MQSTICLINVSINYDRNLGWRSWITPRNVNQTHPQNGKVSGSPRTRMQIFTCDPSSGPASGKPCHKYHRNTAARRCVSSRESTGCNFSWTVYYKICRWIVFWAWPRLSADWRSTPPVWSSRTSPRRTRTGTWSSWWGWDRTCPPATRITGSCSGPPRCPKAPGFPRSFPPGPRPPWGWCCFPRCWCPRRSWRCSPRFSVCLFCRRCCWHSH